MKTLVDRLFPDGRPEVAEFRPMARYFGPIDAMIYVRDDVSYRADRVDPFLTVLWHPTEDRLVGVKLKGFRFLFERLSAVAPEVSTNDFLPLVKALEIALAAGVGEVLTDGLEKKLQRDRKYEQARQLIRDVSVPNRDLPQAA